MAGRGEGFKAPSCSPDNHGSPSKRTVKITCKIISYRLFLFLAWGGAGFSPSEPISSHRLLLGSLFSINVKVLMKGVRS